MYEKPNLCAECGGKCCKSYPGDCFPGDFDNDPAKIKTAIEGGMYAIDWWVGDPRSDYDDDDDFTPFFFVRPAVKGLEGMVYSPLEKGVCTFLEGLCILKPHSRPRGCREIEPRREGCTSHIRPKRDAAIAWLPFKDLLESF